MQIIGKSVMENHMSYMPTFTKFGIKKEYYEIMSFITELFVSIRKGERKFSQDVINECLPKFGEFLNDNECLNYAITLISQVCIEKEEIYENGFLHNIIDQVINKYESFKPQIIYTLMCVCVSRIIDDEKINRLIHMIMFEFESINLINKPELIIDLTKAFLGRGDRTADFELFLSHIIKDIIEKPDLIRLVVCSAAQVYFSHKKTLAIMCIADKLNFLLLELQNEAFENVIYDDVIGGYCDACFIRLKTSENLEIFDILTMTIGFCRNSAFAIAENLVKMFYICECTPKLARKQEPNGRALGIAKIAAYIINKSAEQIRVGGMRWKEKIQDLVATMVHCLMINLLFSDKVPVDDIAIILCDIRNNVSSNFDLPHIVDAAIEETDRRLSGLSTDQKNEILVEWLWVFYGVKELSLHLKNDLRKVMELVKKSKSKSLLDSVTQTTTTTTDETAKPKTGCATVESLSSAMDTLDGSLKHQSGDLTDKNNPGNNGISSEKNQDTSRFWQGREKKRIPNICSIM